MARSAANLSSLRIEYTLPALTLHHTGWGDYYDLAGLTIAKPDQPIQPKFWDDVTSGEGPAHGALLLAATYRDETNFNPVIVAAGVAQGSVPAEEPPFVSSSFYPALPHALNTRQTIDGANQATLVVSAGQFDASTSTERLYETFTTDIYYSPTADETPPQIGRVTYQVLSDAIRVTVPVSDTSGVQRVVATYTNGAGADGRGAWQSVEMAPAGTGVWAGAIPLLSPTWFFVQAVDVAGNIAADANAVASQQGTPGGSGTDTGDYYAYLGALPVSTATSTGGRVTLRWAHLGPQIARYEVWRRSAPYFTAGDAGSTKVATYLSPFAAELTFTDTEAQMTPGAAYFYLVRAIDLYGRPVALSAGVGSFTFGMSPGH